MRYEDASGAFQASGPVANDDSDTLAAGSRGPATGNLITGEGTQYGSSGADSAAGGHITAIAGKGGEDSSFAGGKLSVAGEFGQLSVDAEGNYVYMANKGAPENVRDRFTYTLADSQGNSDTAALIVEIGKTPVVIKADAQQIVPGPDGVVTLPPGVELSDIMVVGRNLVINMPDGTQLVIVDGAVFVPQLVLGGVEVPASNVAALLIGQEPQPAAGETPPSSGGNFALPPPPLDPGVPLGDLLPPTEYNYTPPEPQETFLPEDEDPEVLIQPEDQQPSVAAVDQVEEAGLPERDGDLLDEPAGSAESADGNGADNDVNSEATTGTIIINSPDGVASVTINGVEVTGVVGQQFAGAFGTLTVEGFDGDNILYSYLLHDNTSGNDTHDDFSVVLTDSDGDVASATLRIDIIDDVPTARPDTDTVGDGENPFVATGNVMTDAAPGDAGDSDTNAADTVGADNARVTFIDSVNAAPGANVPNGGFVDIAGQYGNLRIFSNGDYEYTRGQDTPGGVQDVFNYTLTDGDGDTSVTTLTISIPDRQPDLPDPAAVLLDDDALANGNPGGTGDDVDSQGTPGQLAGSGGDGDLDYGFTGANTLPAGFSVNVVNSGQIQILQGATVVLTVTLNTETGAFNVVQNNPIDHPAGLDENNLSFNIGVQVIDADGDTDPATITINVDDDTPEMNRVDISVPTLHVDETVLATNDSGDFSVVFDGDYGADGPGTTSYAVTTVNGTDSGLVDVATGLPVLLYNIGGVVTGSTSATLGGVSAGNTVFTVSVNSATGVVTLDQVRAVEHPDTANPDDPVSPIATSIQLTATITDGDGDSDSLSVNIGNNLILDDDGPSVTPSGVEPQLTVDESELTINDTKNFGDAFNEIFGADGPASSNSVSYALGINAGSTGLVDTLSGEDVVLVLNGGVVEGRTEVGNLLVFTISVASNGDVVVDQLRAVVHPDQNNPDDSINIANDNLITLTATVTDGDGDTASATIGIGNNVHLEDDGPAVTPTLNAQVTVAVDESLPSNDPAINTGVIVKGDDPDLAGGLAIGQANSGSAIVDPHAVFGADGPAASNSLTYALSILNVSSGLTLTDGTPINLQNVNGVIVGVVASGTFAGQAAFAIAINPATGVVSVEQYLSLDHPLNPNPNEPLSFGSNVIGVTVTATDGDGDDVTSPAVDVGGQISFFDDGPSANNDTDAIDLVTNQAVGNVITGVGTTEGAGNADVPGADGYGSITNLVGFGGSSDNNPLGGFTVNGQFGSLQMDANGNYTYTRTDGLGGGQSEVFTYTYVDGDGDPATATLTISIPDNAPTAGTVNLAFDDDVIPGKNGILDGPGDDDPDVVGQNVANGTLPGSGGDGALTFGFGANVAPAGFTYDTSVANTLLIKQGSTTVITITIDPATGAYTVTQNNPIDHATGGDENNQTFAINYTVKDVDNDTAQGTININVDDDSPVAVASAAGFSISHDETVGNQGDANDVSGPLAQFAGVVNPGDDPDVAGTAAIGFAISTGAIGSTGSGYGADGAGSTVFSLNISSTGVDSGLNTTSGQDIFLFKEGSLVVGRVGNSSGPAAFAIAIDASTGQVSMVQYLSIQHPNTGSNDESVSLTNTVIQATVTVTDHDGDVANNSVNIGSLISFQDDGPTAGIVTTGQAVSLDETAGNQGDANDVTGPLAAFAGVANVGDDPDVAGTGPIQFATNASALVAATGSSYGVDGAGTTVFSLNIPSSGVDSGLNTTSGQDIFLFKEGALIVGRVGNSSGPAAFAIAIDPSTGAVSMVEYLSIQHPNTGNPDDSVSITNSSVQATVTVTDGDGDSVTSSVNIGSQLQFQDDGPAAAIVTTGQTVSLDESAGNQVDSNDVTGPLAAFAGVANVGDDPDVAGTGPIQFAANANPIVASTGTTFGADGGSVAYSLNVSSAGVDSGLNTTSGQDIFLFKEGSVVVGRVGNGAGPAAFAIAIDPVTGAVSMVEYLSIQHPNPANPDDSVSIANGALLATATATDGDGDTNAASVAIGSLISFQDSGPVMTAASNINIQNSGDVAHTGTFAFNLGADGANTSNDVITNVTGSATVGGVPVTNWNLVAGVENATTASYSFSFNYSIGGGNTAQATGTLVFDKVAGTYTVDFANPIQGVTTILQTAQGTLFQGYEFGTANLDGSQPEISVTQIQDLAGTANDIYVQFTSVAEPSSGTGNNALEVTNWVPGADNPPPIDAPPNPDASDFSWSAGQLFNQEDSWVSTSNDANGVAGDTIQGGEVLDFNLVRGNNPTGTLADPANYAQASAMFLKFDGIGTGEDMIVILKLYDPSKPPGEQYTTRAIMIENSDIQKGPGAGPGQYSGVTLDNNDGLVIIEANDYNLPGENWVIVGAQIAGSDEDVTGTAINLNPVVGAPGDSVTGNAFDTDPLGFQSDTNDGPFKISSIGFLTTQTTPQNAHLDFNVTVTDGDGDSITQAIAVDVTAAADSSTPIVLGGGVTTIQSVGGESATSSFSNLSYENDNQKWHGNGNDKNFSLNNTGIVAGIVAAAGLQSVSAAASPSIEQSFDLDLQGLSNTILPQYSLQQIDDGALGVQSFGVEQIEPAFDLSALQGSGHGFNDYVSNGGLDVQAYGEAVPAYEPSFALDQAPAYDASMLVAVAPTVGMPSAEALVAAGLVGNAQHGGAVEQIVAEALGNAAPTVDALLEAVNGNGQQAILEALSNVPDGGAGGDMSAILNGTSGLGVGVSSWDIGSHGAFGATADMMFKMDVASFHQDAVQPAVNG